MQRIITYTILSGDSETSVLSFLRKNGFSKHILTTMKRAEHAILLNGHPAFGRTVLKEGDVLRILVPEENGAADNGSAASIIPVQLLTAGVFVIAAFLGTATGTSVGTITALVPIAVGLLICLCILLPGTTRILLPTEWPGIINSRGKILSTAVSTGWTGILPEFLSWQKIP